VKDEMWKHNGRSCFSIEERKKEFKYYCESCDFGHFTKGLFKLHMEAKHATT
jgi:hypothetical protein